MSDTLRPVVHVWRPVPITDEEWEASYGPLFGDIYQKARCPDCGALITATGICLNACHLSTGQYRRFQAGLDDAQRRIRAREQGDGHD